MYKKLYNKTMEEKIRINKYLSEAGICSRREADRMIEEGRLTVNGKKAESGQKVSLEDEICADNIPAVSYTHLHHNTERRKKWQV